MRPLSGIQEVILGLSLLTPVRLHRPTSFSMRSSLFHVYTAHTHSDILLSLSCLISGHSRMR